MSVPAGVRPEVWRRALTVIVLVLVVVSVAVLRGVTPAAPGAVREIDQASLLPGDLLFVDIYDGWSQAGYWDHMAVYLAEPYPAVVEATYNAGITLTFLDVFLERDLPAKVAVRRLKDGPGREEIIRQAVEYAALQVGRAFDYTATATLPLKLNAGNLHCAEVAWRSFRAAGVDLDSNGGLLVYPDDIYFHPDLVTL